MNSKEILAYILVAIITFVAASIGVLFYKTPNFRDPLNPDLPKVPEPTGGLQPSTSSNFGFYRIILYALLVIGGIILLYFLVQSLNYTLTNLKQRKSTQRSSTAVAQRRKLEDARSKAYEIIAEGLATGKYTRAYIEAYIALDRGLENFREISRPKHVTPKEYAFSVSPPVFQAGVFRTVSVYYDLRFGHHNASQDQLLGFRQQLDYLFLEDVPPSIKEDWSHIFETAIKKDYEFKIPRIIDQTRPGGK